MQYKKMCNIKKCPCIYTYIDNIKAKSLYIYIYSTTKYWTLTKLCGRRGYESGKNPFNFGADSDLAISQIPKT
mgnify:CR=1 FL=1